MPKLSIIIPVYNAQKYLSQCLDSVLNQSFKDIEIICVDDGSIDNSLKLLKEYAAKDSRIVVLTQNNSGPANARNLGIKNAKSKVITFLDADDWITTKTSYEKLYETFIKNELDLLVFDHNEYNDEKQEMLFDLERHFIFNYENNDYDRQLTFNEFQKYIFHFTPFPWNKFYKKQMLLDNDIYFPQDLVAGEDSAFALYSILYSRKIYVTKEKHINYRTNLKKSLTTAKIHTHLDYPVQVCSAIYDFLNARDLYNKYKIEFLVSCALRLLNHYLKQLKYSHERENFINMVKCFFARFNIKKKDLRAMAKYNFYAIELMHIYLGIPIYIEYQILGFIPFLLIKKSLFSKKYYVMGVPLFFVQYINKYSRNIYLFNKLIRILRIKSW